MKWVYGVPLSNQQAMVRDFMAVALSKNRKMNMTQLKEYISRREKMNQNTIEKSVWKVVALEALKGRGNFIDFVREGGLVEVRFFIRKKEEFSDVVRR